MNVQVKVDGRLAYDSRLPEEMGYTMGSIRICETLNKGGSATFILPSQHPLRDDFRAYQSEVIIYRDGKLRWRGRPLPRSCDRLNRRTITCEGELCFLQDATLRPRTITGSPSKIFTEVVNTYNGTVDNWKRFVVGAVTVTSNVNVPFEIKNAQSVYAAVQSLIKSYGGYIIFDSTTNGSRRINWYAELPYTCNQRIQWGSNLTDYSTSTDTSGFATRIVPYGALDQDGNRITIDVGGKDYVENAEAVATRGIIEIPKVYSKISDPAELLAEAQRDVDRAGVLPETIKISSVDLSRQDTGLDSFMMGQRVCADAAPYDLSGLYDLTSMDEDLLDAYIGKITLTRETEYTDGPGRSLTGAIAYSVANKSSSEKEAETENYANSAAHKAVNAQTREDIFNKLTDNGKIQGIYQQDGKWHINAELAKIINLIADHVKSVKGTQTMEIDGGRLSFLISGSVLASMGTDNLGRAELMFVEYDKATGKPMFYSRMASGGFVAQGDPDYYGISNVAQMGIDRNGNSYADFNMLRGKNIWWEPDGNGNYTLKGADI